MDGRFIHHPHTPTGVARPGSKGMRFHMATKSGSTRVPTAKLLATCSKLGLEVVTKAGWFLAFAPGVKGKRLLVHTGKKGTNCIELVGFESEFAISHPCPPAKTMTQMLDCNLEQALVLRNFFKTAKLLVTAVASVPVETATSAVDAEIAAGEAALSQAMSVNPASTEAAVAAALA